VDAYFEDSIARHPQISPYWWHCFVSIDSPALDNVPVLVDDEGADIVESC
jgi:hypothetical protein